MQNYFVGRRGRGRGVGGLLTLFLFIYLRRESFEKFIF
jgi:hypothetical protein